MKDKNLETIVGAIVILIAVYFIYAMYNISGRGGSDSDGYVVNANFGNADGLSLGGDVRISGVKVGSISSYKLDKDTYDAIISMSIDKDVRLPADSSAAIVSSGLLGNKYISIDPGAEDKMLDNNSYIMFTQSSVNLETLIGKMIFSKENEDSGLSE